MFGHNQWDIKSFNAFSDEAVATTDDPSIQAISQEIEIPVWTFTENTDSNGHPTEKFERTIDTPFGSVTQHKEVLHPDPATMQGHPTFDVTIHSVFTDANNETSERTDTQTVQDPHMFGEWELSGLDEWLVPETVEDDEDDEDEEPEELASGKESSKPTESKPLFCMSCPAGYILGGIGVLAGAYMYFIIRNPQAYVQATAIRTGGGLVGQLLS